jgi:acetate kinase
MKILALNVGSSSLKFGIYCADGITVAPHAEGDVDLRSGRVNYHGVTGDGQLAFRGGARDQALGVLLGLAPKGTVDVVAHRVVHGGPHLREHCLIDAPVLGKINEAASFAPLHVPAALTWIHEAMRSCPQVMQVACFDTAFHYPLPDLARVLPVPGEWRERGVERFGFHGLSCESILAQLDKPPPRLVIAHLGSGASLTALRDGRSVDTTMGMTPMGGIIMGTRPGDIDPGVLMFLLRQGHCSPTELDDLLERRCGLKGISGVSADARELAGMAGHPLSRLALDQFAQSVARHVAGLAIVLGGIDLLVFTGGIGEHDMPMRNQIIELLSPCFPSLAVRMLPAQENVVMARHAARLAGKRA